MYELIYILMACLVMMQLASWTMTRNPTSNGSSDVRTDNRRSYFNGVGAAWDLNQFWLSFINEYGMPTLRYCISTIYAIYLSLTITNVLIFLLKFVLSGFFTCKSLKDYYTTAQDRIKQKNVELEDIQLQIKIVNEKLFVRDAEYKERAEQLRRGAGRLRAVRARVRGLIAADDSLRRALEDAGPYADNDEDLCMHVTPEEEEEFIETLLKELKQDQTAIPERHPDKMECGEPVSNVPSESSVYSSVEDGGSGEIKQDCRIKIVKVTNVYKVAYLKHYIKQKKLRKATQQALLKKKIEGIKKLLEGWQKSLNMVINSKLLLDTSNPLDVASQEAMGDYSKPIVRESDSDSDLVKHSEGYFDEYSLRWSQGPYRNYGYGFEEVPDVSGTKEYFEAQEYELKYNQHTTNVTCECNGSQNVLFILPEETNSQMAIEEIKDDEPENESDCRDIDLDAV